MRVKKGVRAHRRHKKITKKTKGHLKSRSRKFKRAKEAYLKAGQYSYRDRRNKKRNFRRLWITQINGALKKYDLSYSRFVNGLTSAKIELDRKMLAKLTTSNPATFEKIVHIVQKTLDIAG